MLDVRDESITHPQPFPLSHYHSILVLAPHPDDEIYGCGGLLLLARDLGIPVHALVLTDGAAGSDAAGYAAQRKNESLAAAKVVGHTLDFAAMQDRSVRLGPPLYGAISSALAQLQPDLVLAPSLNDPHPDHQAVALAAVHVLGAAPHCADLAFYEVNGGLTQVSHLVNTTSVYARKRQAMACFVSQEAQLPYASRIEARDNFRAFVMGQYATHAEAFFLAPLKAVGFRALLPAMDPLFRHGHFGAAAYPSEVANVSVLIRTIGDAWLERAVASVLAQSYPVHEIVVVCASGVDTLSNFPHLQQHHKVRCIVPDQALSRPAAANAALDAASGQYLIFLDDDDFWLPGHLQQLINGLHSHPETLAAHSAVEVQNTSGVLLRHYAFNVSVERLFATNLLPIHSVLFDRKLIDVLDCRFDTSLPKLEDWDFWLQVVQHTGFVLCNAVTAVYRYRDRTGLFHNGDVASTSAQAVRMAIYAKWRTRMGASVLDASLAWHAARLDELELQSIQHEQQVANLTNEVAQAQKQNLQLQSQFEAQEHKLKALKNQLAATQNEHGACLNSILDLQQMHGKQVQELNEHHQATVIAIHQSHSWRVTAPLRWFAKTFIYKGR